MIEKIIKPIPITKENFSKFGEVITTENIIPLEINNGYAKRFDEIAKIDTSTQEGETTISIFSALKRSFPMKIDMMEKHPLGSQAFIPMKETIFLTFVAPQGEKPNIEKIESLTTLKKLETINGNGRPIELDRKKKYKKKKFYKKKFFKKKNN